MATIVKPKPGDDNDSLVKRFKRQVAADNVIDEVKKRQRYVKPSQVRKEKRKEHERRRQAARRAHQNK